jgi:cyclophilin family peptidyl-prolyl cis-trans isomerase
VKRLLVLLLCLAAPALAQDAERPPRVGDERVLLRTNRGDLVLAFYPDVAPKHTAQILKLVRMGLYDTTYIHRVEPGFVAQLTNVQNRREPLSPEQLAAIQKLPAEFSPIKHRAGLLSMAREDADVNSAETSFSFMLAAAPHLDGKYTIFGEVQFGRPLLAMISGEPRDAKNTPRSPINIERATVLSAAEYLRMRSANELREAIPLPPSDLVAANQAAAADTAAGAAPGKGNEVAMAGIALMLLCNVVVFLFGSKWSPQTQGAVNVLAVLVGAFVLFIEYGTRARGSPLMAIAVFFGIVALFKLMNRFESAPRVEKKPT